MANDFINNMTDKAKNAAEFAAKKTNIAVEQAKNKVKIMDFKKKVEKAFIEIGQLTYDAASSGEDVGQKVSVLINQIDGYNETIENLIDANIALRGHTKCLSCGAENPLENSFCSGCGASLRE